MGLGGEGYSDGFWFDALKHFHALFPGFKPDLFNSVDLLKPVGVFSNMLCKTAFKSVIVEQDV